jgi:hypothetical protein
MLMESRPMVRIGCGSAYADDDVDLAVNMIKYGRVSYLAMDSLAERTLSLAQLRRRQDPAAGFDERLAEIARRVLPEAAARGIRIIGNMGAANPARAGELLADAIRAQGRTGRVAVITGDDVMSAVRKDDPVIAETGKPASALGDMISANAYTGCASIVAALAQDADVVVGGRIADPSLFVGPLAHEFGWELDDWNMIGRATCAAHLLECGVYVTGGNYADPPFVNVASLENPSMPLAEVYADGSFRLEKLDGTGGVLSPMTCKLQLGYEIHDPMHYLTPDVTADFTAVTVAEEGDGVVVEGATGTAKPESLKVLVGVREGYIGEGQVSFAGPGAATRGKLARDTVRRKVDALLDAGEITEARYDLLGLDALHGAATPPDAPEPYEVHLRVAGRAPTPEAAGKVAIAVEHLQLFGPAGTSGHRRQVRPVIAMYSTYIPRTSIHEEVEILSA